MKKSLEQFDLHFTKLTEASLKVLYWFFAYPQRQIGLNDLAAETKIAKSTAKRVVEEFVKIGFLKKEIIGNVWRISCNQQHEYNHTIKIGYNLISIYQARILEEIHKKIGYSGAIVLFGSYRKGDDNEKSDIDIAVEVGEDQKLKIEKLKVLPNIGYRINIPVNLHIFSRKNIDINLFANIANGIVLDGFLEVRS